ncbi:MAG: HPr family phosphocarrier protein [Lachnospiraceae bacterium]|nr:HPr family phosphocarrier protein [Lachnospiraceae bacterium]MDD3659709.1 HPr family phosphocarrier protein [Lachnospiraceae bacterium]
MKDFQYKVMDPIGIHARPAGLLVKEAMKFGSSITLEKGGKSVDAKRIMAVMGLGVKQGEEVTVKADGADEEAAIVALRSFFQSNF